jgi:hypothetical protein
MGEEHRESKLCYIYFADPYPQNEVGLTDGLDQVRFSPFTTFFEFFFKFAGVVMSPHYGIQTLPGSQPIAARGPLDLTGAQMDVGHHGCGRCLVRSAVTAGPTCRPQRSRC